MFCERQGIKAKIPFRDGTEPEYTRTYLVLNADEKGMTVLNVSSIKGKEHKLFFPSNYKLKEYSPPFRKPCFVKLDSSVYVPKEDFDLYEIKGLHNGDLLNITDFSEIKRKMSP